MIDLKVEEKLSHRPKIAIVLETGNLTTLAAIPLIEFFHEWGIPIDLVYGASGGALAAGLWALDFDIKSIIFAMPEMIFRTETKRQLNYSTLFSLWRMPNLYNYSKGLSKSQSLLETLRHIFQEYHIEDLKKKVVIGCTDFVTGKEVSIQSGVLAEAIYASRALSPLLPPHKINKQWLCDAGWGRKYWILDQFRADYDIVVVLDVTLDYEIQPINFLDHTIQFFKKLNGERGVEYGNCLPNAIFLHHRVTGCLDTKGKPDMELMLSELNNFITGSEELVFKKINDHLIRKNQENEK